MKVHTGIKRVATIVLMVVLRFSITMAVKGYEMYREAVDSMSLEDKVASIRAKESYITFDQLPEIYADAVLSVEDYRFYDHSGIDVIAVGRAVLNDIKTEASVEGGSTVTQQLARNMYSSQEKELIRKVAEVLMAPDLEKNYSKNKILELYVNIIYYGSGYYCVRDASNDYFGKEPGDMTDYESTSLAGVLNASSCHIPTVSQELATRRQQQAPDRLVKRGYLEEERTLRTMAAGSSR